MPAFRRRPLKKWKDKVKSNGGVWRHRWGDAPLRTIVAAKFFNKTRVSRFCDFSYGHSAWAPFLPCDKYNGKRLTDEYGWNVVGNNHAWSDESADDEEWSNESGDDDEEGVSCGGHRALSCEKCPFGKGEGWCNGECKWCGSTKKCMTSFQHHEMCSASKDLED